MKTLVYKLLPAVLVLAACSKAEITTPGRDVDPSLQAAENASMLSATDGLSKATFKELAQVRAATAKYHNIEMAIADGYEDLNFVVPGMGHHWVNNSYFNDVFELTKPEILVYSMDENNGRLKLVAVEYANTSTDAPEGFTGDADVWIPFGSEGGPWVLHAWIFKHNPDGMFNSTNPNVP